MFSTEISPDVAALVEALKAVPPGGPITFAALSEVIGRDVTDQRYLLTSARRIVQRDHGAVFASQRGDGLVRLTTEQLHQVGHTARNRIRRGARRAVKAITHGLSRANDIAPETQRQLNAEVSALALIEHVAADRAAKPVAVHDSRPEPVAIMAQRLFGGQAA